MRGIHAMVAAAIAFAGSIVLPPSTYAEPARGLQVLEPWQTVPIEHADRKARLIRLANLRGVAPPEFYEYSISPSQHRLPDYPVDIPVLRVVFPEGVLFDFNKDEVKPEAAQVLNLIAESLRREPPDVTLFISGHTDAIGSVSYNLNLGLRRSKAVAAALAELGVNSAHLFAISFGKAVPVAPNDNEEGRARNRRVEFLFAARMEAVAQWLTMQDAMPCGDRRYTDGQECPRNVIVTGVSVTTIPMAVPRTNVALPSPRVSIPTRQPRTQVPQTNQTENVPLQKSRTVIQFGDRVVDIDLRQKIYRFRAPE